MNSKIDISVVIPIWNEEENVKELYIQLKKVLDSIKKKHQIIFVDDGSTDNTYKILSNLSKKDKRLKIIRFRKNFGKSAALSAGFKYSEGKIIITMDGDLQDDPKEIPKFLEKIKENDLVVGWKFERKDPFGKRVFSKIFNKLTSILTGVKVHDSNCCFKAYRGEVIESLNIYGELHRYIPSLVKWKGFNISEIKVVHHPRKYGKSKYGSLRILRGFLDLLTIKFLMSYTKKPLHLFGSTGLLSSFIGFIIGLYLVYSKYFLNQGIGNRPLLFLSMLLIILGIQFISIGLLAEMIASNSPKSEDYMIKTIIN